MIGALSSAPFSFEREHMDHSITIDGHSGSIVPVAEGAGIVRFNGDSNLNVAFYNRPVLDPIESQKRGRPWNRSVEYVRIQIPGEKDYTDRPATDMDHGRFPRQHQAYLKGQQPIPNGTPIDHLFPQNPEISLNLHGLGVHTVEQLAGLTEHGAQTIGMGATQWRDMAKKFLDAAKGGASLHQLQKELSDRDSKIEVLSNQIKQQAAQIDRLMALVEQKIPPNMVPQARATQAQVHAQAMAYAAEENGPEQSGGYEPTTLAEQSASAEPLFVEEQEESAPIDEEAAPAPAKRGPGRPRKNP
jgi:hypothetical protein